jgi:hypothetical protein
LFCEQTRTQEKKIVQETAETAETESPVQDCQREKRVQPEERQRDRETERYFFKGEYSEKSERTDRGRGR